MSLTLIFDSMQTLFSFRQANWQLAENLDKVIPGVQTGHILKNYRSPKQLVILSNLFSDLFRGTLEVEHSVPHNPSMESVLEVSEFDTTQAEIKYTVDTISKLHEQGVAWKDIAILARVNRTLQNFESGLISNKIPYIIKYDSRSILNQSAFRMMFAVYSLLFNPKDINSLLEIVSAIKGIGKKFLDKLRAKLRDKPNLNCFEISERDFDESSKQFKTFFLFMDKIIRPIRVIFNNNNSFVEFNRSVRILFGEVLEFEGGAYVDTPLKIKIEKEYFHRVFKTFKNIYLVMAEDFDFKVKSDLGRFIEIYQNLQLSLDTYSEKKEKDVVLLSTVHSFKGKQADHVFFVNLRGLTSNNINDHDEKCCFYVAVTRAKRKLYLFSSDRVLSYKGELLPSLNNPFLTMYTAGIPRMKEILSKENS